MSSNLKAFILGVTSTVGHVRQPLCQAMSSYVFDLSRNGGGVKGRVSGCVSRCVSGVSVMSGVSRRLFTVVLGHR